MFISINHRAAPDSWRSPQVAGSMSGRRRLHKYIAKEKAAAVTRLEDLSLQPCRRYRINGHVCRPHDRFSTTIWIGTRTWFIYSFDKKYPQRTRLHFIRRYHLRTVSVFGTADGTEFE